MNSSQHNDLSLRDTFAAIEYCRNFLQNELSQKLNLTKVIVPLFVKSETGINDDLDGIKKPVTFELKNEGSPIKVEIIQAATKWKRLALRDYGFKTGEGVITDIRAIRKDYKLDKNHSAFVDQFDWEVIIEEKDRNLDFLKRTVNTLYQILKDTEAYIREKHPQLGSTNKLPDSIKFIHTEDLDEQYPDLERNEREEKALKEHGGAIFLIGIGWKLKNSGKPHEERAPDYDDWSTEVQDNGKTYHGLNGDILIWNELLGRRHELSSMGIRVTKDNLIPQLDKTGDLDRKDLYFHQRLLKGDLTDCIGGGIGISRVLQFILQKQHIGQVSCSVWPDGEDKDVKLL